MALFFDQEWFDQHLKGRGLSRDDVAEALRLMRSEVDEIWKDQREISSTEVAILARLLQAPAHEVVTRAGVTTPMPQAEHDQMSRDKGDTSAVMAKLEEMDERLLRMERAISDLQSMIVATRSI